METILSLIATGLYLFFAIRWGFRFINGRWTVLEKPKMKPLKIVVAVILGCLTLGIYLLLWCVKKIEEIFKR